MRMALDSLWRKKRDIDQRWIREHEGDEIKWNKTSSSTTVNSDPQVQDKSNEIDINIDEKNIIVFTEEYIESYIKLCDRRDKLLEKLKNNEYVGTDREYAARIVITGLLSQVEQLLPSLVQEYTRFIQSLDDVQLKETAKIMDKKKTDLERKLEEVSQRYSLVKSKSDAAKANGKLAEWTEYWDIETDCEMEITSIKRQLPGYEKFANELDYLASQKITNDFRSSGPVR